VLFADVLIEMAVLKQMAAYGNYKWPLKYRRKGWHKQNYIFVEFRTGNGGTLEPHVMFRYGDGTAAKYYPDGNELFAADWEIVPDATDEISAGVTGKSFKPTVENDGDEITELERRIFREALNRINESILHTETISELSKLVDRFHIWDKSTNKD
jgi:hypothetical protein